MQGWDHHPSLRGALSDLTGPKGAEMEESKEPLFVLVVDAFHQGEGLRNVYAAFGPFVQSEVEESTDNLRRFTAEVRTDLLWEDGTPATDPGITPVSLYDSVFDLGLEHA